MGRSACSLRNGAYACSPARQRQHAVARDAALREDLTMTSVFPRSTMHISKLWAPSVAAIALFASAGAARALEASPIGVWLNDTGRGAIEIKTCGDKLCGHVVWVQSQSDVAKGCGRQIIGDVNIARPTAANSGEWTGGWIYSPERKRTYSVALRPLKDGTLSVTGYAGSRFFSRTMIWKHAAPDLVRCDRPSEAKAGDAKPTSAATPAASANTITSAAAPPATQTQPSEKAMPSPEQAAITPTPAPAAKDAEAPIKTPIDTTPSADVQAGTSTTESDHSASDTMKIGGVDIEKVFTRTSNGRCKLDLPWVKLDVRCDRD